MGGVDVGYYSLLSVERGVGGRGGSPDEAVDWGEHVCWVLEDGEVRAAAGWSLIVGQASHSGMRAVNLQAL